MLQLWLDKRYFLGFVNIHKNCCKEVTNIAVKSINCPVMEVLTAVKSINCAVKSIKNS